MRTVLIGQAAFGEKVLEALAEKGEEVVGVFTIPDTPGRGNPVKELAQKLGIPTFQPQRMRHPQAYEDFARLEPDLCVMAFVTDIVPESILNCPKLGTIEYHPSLLPRHRGASAINWAVTQGDTRTGLTIFWVDKGIDTGPILLEREVEISPTDTMGSLYFNKLFPLGVEAMVESVELVKRGIAPHIPQDESKATYEKPCEEKDSIIDWSKPATEVYNLIRGSDPQPGASSHFKGQRVKIFDSELRPSPPETAPGRVTEINDQGFVVSAQGGSILVKRVQPQGSAKIGAKDYVQSAGMRVGEGFEHLLA